MRIGANIRNKANVPPMYPTILLPVHTHTLLCGWESIFVPLTDHSNRLLLAKYISEWNLTPAPATWVRYVAAPKEWEQFASNTQRDLMPTRTKEKRERERRRAVTWTDGRGCEGKERMSEGNSEGLDIRIAS